MSERREGSPTEETSEVLERGRPTTVGAQQLFAEGERGRATKARRYEVNKVALSVMRIGERG